MAIRKVALMGHPILRKVAAPVPKDTIKGREIQDLIHDMVETMVEYNGRGLAAPQVHESLRLAVIYWDFEGKDSERIVTLINPIIKVIGKDVASEWEGCLSVPGLRGSVTRPSHIEVTALDAHGISIHFEAKGFCATVIQHECDHLEGKLYVDRMDDFRRFAFNREYQRFFGESS